MDTKLIAAFACAAALALGACSGNNASGTTGEGDRPGAGSGTDGGNGGADGGNGNGGTDGNGGGGGNPDGNGNSGADPTPLQTAQTRLSEAQRAATQAVQMASLAAAAGGEEARVNAETQIRLASRALDDAVKAAEEAERAASAAGSLADVGLAARAIIAATQLRSDQAPALEAARQSLAWFGRALARYELAAGEASTPSDGTNTVTINRIPRTIDRSATDSTQVTNTLENNRGLQKARFNADTFKTVMYEDGKKLFSDVDVEFKVDGYTRMSFSTFGVEGNMHSGVKLTRNGLVIRTGGGKPSANASIEADFADMRRDITRQTDDTNNDRRVHGSDGLPGQNGWDLEITFINAPRTMPVPNAPDGRNWVASWQGNGDFYWKAIVPAAKSQTDTDGKYYEPDAFPQPDGYKDLGTYQVWLSNHIGVKRNLEPPPGREGTCLDGSRGTSCPGDDEQFYLDYAAYGLFVYTANTKTWKGASGAQHNGQNGRAQSLSFGYSAFADEDNKRTTDIGEPIAGGKFQGQALAYAYKGTNANNEFKMLRGDAALTVTIPKTGSGTITGTLNNFKEWTAAGWKVYGTDFKVDLTSNAFSNAGVFSGSATATGGVALGSGGGFKGSFYGPRDKSADLEVAGSWNLGAGSNSDSNWDMVGSFGAKQRPAAATPGS